MALFDKSRPNGVCRAFKLQPECQIQSLFLDINKTLDQVIDRLNTKTN